MKRIRLWLTMTAMLLCSITAGAHDFEVDGIYYNIVSKDSVEVTSGDDMYHGYIYIPDFIFFDNIMYWVDRIGDGAFSSCYSLTSISIPSSVRHIGNGAFSFCSSLTSISIPNSVKNIGDEAFSYCTELTTIEFPNAVEHIGEGVLACCSKLSYIWVDPLNQHYKIENNSLLSSDGQLLLAVPANNSNLSATYEVPSGVTRIANYAFANNKYVNRIELPEGVVSIGDYAFGAMKSESIALSLPTTLTEIGNNIFLANHNATIKVEIWATTPPVVHGFFGTYTPILVCVPKGTIEAYDVEPWNEETLVERVEINEVFNVEGISYRKIAEDACEVVGTVDKTLDIVQIPSPVEYNAQIFHVTTIGNRSFEGDTDLTAIVLPASVTSIGNSAFTGCSSLEVFTMIGTTPPTTGTDIYDGCDNLSTIYVPAIAKAAYDVAPWDAYTIAEMPQKGTVFEVDGFSFEVVGDVLECSIIGGTVDTSTLTIPSMVKYNGMIFKVTSIGSSYTRAFAYSKYTSVVIPNTVKHIDGFVFQYSALSSLTIPSSVVDINPFAFCDCVELVSITVDPANKIYDSREDCNAIIETNTNTLFKGCSSTIIPSSVTKLGEQSFRGSGITTISIPNSITEILIGAFFECKKLTSVIIPNSVTFIDTQAFGDCYNLPYITIPNSVSYFGLGAFSNCFNLKTVTLPNTLTDIGVFTFSNCASLANVVMLGTSVPKEMPYGGSVFYLCPDDLTIYSPLGTEDAYQNWSGLPAKDTHMLIEPSSYISDSEYEDCNIAYRRDFEDTNWQAWYVPFDMIYDKMYEDFVVARLGDIVHIDDDGDGAYDRWQLEIIRLNQGDLIEANRPYVIRANGVSSPTFVAKNTTLYASEEKIFECFTATGRYTVHGVYNSPELGVKPYRWYLQDESGHSYTFDKISLLDQEAWRDEAGAESITFNCTEITLVEGESFVLETSITPFYSADKYNITCSSSNEMIVARNSNAPHLYEYIGREPGTAIITATLSNGVSTSCKVTVLASSHTFTAISDGEILFTDTLAHGDSIMPVIATIPQPTKEGHTFNGWKIIDKYSGKYVDCPEFMPEENLTLISEFTVNKYLVTFKIDDRIIRSDSLAYGEEISGWLLYYPPKEERIFRWNNLMETVPAYDVVFEGEYGYFVTFMTYGVEYAKYSLFSLDKITPPDDPEMEWYEFVDWNNLPETMPAEDIIIDADLIPLFEAGDVNGDGRVSVVDVTLLTNHILCIGNSETFVDVTADMNGDKHFSIVDITMITNKILE